ncbi:MFS transporter [Oscillochloris sp. ZM17-4]|uniref:MFS transporter n=1 Tax=Oscillochloris sp. ZM17-4 TaxID=2866714 RepID=UPI001C73C500|nr:MFS transporter [Oscillochloris sp. ZM17-4]MBX0326450.1 MFS transporter [Oscillochloris sp. ZM17-4]
MVAVRARATRGKISPPVWRILLHSSVFGLALSVADLLFNFYLVSLGYTAATAGLFSTIGRAAGMLLGIPLGLLIDRAGAQRAILIGLAVYSAGWVLMLQFTSLWVMMPIQFVIGGAYILASSAVTPLLAGVTSDEQRATIFGWNASASLMVGLVGSAVGGLLPSLAAGAIHVGPQDTAAYRIALTVVVGLSVIAMLPVIGRMPALTADRPVGAAPAPTIPLPMWMLARYALAGLMLGLAGGAFLPFQNLFFRNTFGMSDAAVGAVLAWTALSMGVGGLLGAPVAARLGLRRAAALLRLGCAPAMALMLVPSLVPAAIGFFLRGLFMAASFPLNDALVMRATPPRQRGMATSMMSVLWAGGWAAAAWISGIAQERWGFTPVLIFATACYVVSALAIITLPIGDEDRQ